MPIGSHRLPLAAPLTRHCLLSASQTLAQRIPNFHIESSAQEQQQQQHGTPTNSYTYTVTIGPHISPPSFRAFLNYIYAGRYIPPVPPADDPSTRPPQPAIAKEKTLLYSVAIPLTAKTTPTLLVQLYSLAHQYDVQGLKAAVAKDMLARLNDTNVWEYRDAAKALNLPPVTLMVEGHILKNGLVEGQNGEGHGAPCVMMSRKVKRLSQRNTPMT
ncbi:hypothetical protein DFJ77DRAFT_439869 [Powellomyces hirtus]|nr:hypothetical protein DFJ77DRAFT_439869 [Powellomyces hirtus]